MRYVGLDIHKKYCQATIVDNDGRIIDRKKIPTRKEDIESYFDGVGKCRAVIESTGVWQYVYDTIASKGIDVVLGNPLKTRLIAESKVKTDKIDSEILAQLLRADMIPESYVPPKEIRKLRKLVRERVLLKKITTSLRNHIYAELIRRGIEYKSRCLGSGKGRNRARNDLNDPYFDRLFDLLEFAEESVSDFSYNVLYQEYLVNNDAELLATIDGIGYYTSLTIVAEFGEVCRFKGSDAVISYAGLAPRVHQSSTVCYHGRIRKDGSPILRWILIEAAGNHIIHCKNKSECKLCKFYRRIARRKGKKKAKVATAAKLARIMYWMLKLKKPYQPQGLDPGLCFAGEQRENDWGRLVPGENSVDRHNEGEPRIADS